MEYLYYYLPALEAIRDFLELGGVVLLLIALLMLLMWGLICERLVYLCTVYPRVVQRAVADWEGRAERRSWYARQVREQLVSTAAQGLAQNLALIRSCVTLCPLMGLLGTVTGMIEVFDVIAIFGSGNTRSMAAGVSRATVPTMAGMVAALSGIGASTYLRHRTYREQTLLAERMTMDH